MRGCRRRGAWGVAVCLLVALFASSSAADSRTDAGEAWAETSPGFVVPDDPYLREQWWLYNFGQEIGGRVRGESDADIRAPEAWAITQGSPDVVVALLDFGIDYDHPEFDGQIWTNPAETGDGREANGVDDDGNGYIDDWRGWDFVDGDNDPLDEDGHGTHVAGVVAAKGGDGLGVTGIAPGARVMALRVGGPRGVDLATATPAAIEYAAAMGARIVVQSYTTDPSGLFDQSDAETAAMLAHPELLFVTGAGNDGNDYRDFAGRAGALKPCNNPTVPNLICVAGTDRTDAAWEESTFGVGRVHIAAPAESMLVVARPKDVVFDDAFGSETAWAAATDMPGFWAPVGPAPEFAFEASAAGDSALHITHRPPEGTNSVAVLRLGQRIDLTGRSGCNVHFNVSGTLAGSSTVGIGLFRESDQRRNAFGGELPVTSSELLDAGDAPVPFSFPVRAHEPLELAMRVETRGYGDEIDVQIDELQVVCWKSEHGEHDYEYWAGTSFATPLVAGVAALVASAEPDLDTLQIRDAIIESAVVLPTLDGLVQTGGRVDAFGALQRAAEIASGTAAASTGGDASPAPAGGTTAGPVSFGSHDDYEQPEEGPGLAIPAGRGAPDPASAPADDGASSVDDGNAPAAQRDAQNESDAAGDGGGGTSPLVPLGGGLFAVTIGGVVYYMRKRRDGRFEVVGKEGQTETTPPDPDLVETDAFGRMPDGPALDAERAPWLLGTLSDEQLASLTPDMAEYQTLASTYPGGLEAWLTEKKLAEVKAILDFIDVAGTTVDVAEVIAALATLGAATPAALVPEGKIAAETAKALIREAAQQAAERAAGAARQQMRRPTRRKSASGHMNVGGNKPSPGPDPVPKKNVGPDGYADDAERARGTAEKNPHTSPSAEKQAEDAFGEKKDLGDDPFGLDKQG